MTSPLTDLDEGQEAPRFQHHNAPEGREDPNTVATHPLTTAAKPQERLLRINRFLASAGFGSRRSVEELILKGSVAINGSICRDFSQRVSLEDDVRVNGRQIHQHPLRYFLLHKPVGYVCTRSDRFAERTIFDLLPQEMSTLFHVGRLDKESEGLLLITNDGELANQLLHPSHGIDKEYEVFLDQPFTAKAAAALKKGTWIEGAVARVESVHELGPTKIKLVLHQGIKRQIRVMLGQLGFKVKRLVRTRIGPLKLRQLGLSKYREITPLELEALRKAAGATRVAPLKKKKVNPSVKKSFSFSAEKARRRPLRPFSSSKKDTSTSLGPAKKAQRRPLRSFSSSKKDASTSLASSKRSNKRTQSTYRKRPPR